MLPKSFLDKTACCFTGHRARYLPDGGDEAAPAMRQLKTLLLHRVEEAVSCGVHTFLAGGADGFDTLAAEAVLTRMSLYPELKLVLALPSRTQAAYYSADMRARYARILGAASEVHYASEADNGARAMRSRNRYLVDHADCCIAYLTRGAGGTMYTVNYAFERGLSFYNLAEELL